MENCSACMHSVTLIFPHQLFQKHPALKPGVPVLLVEEWLFFSQYRFHKKKIIFHRASMKCYQAFLEKVGFQVSYEERSDIRDVIRKLALEGLSEISLADPTDDWLLRRVKKACNPFNIHLTLHRTPNFLNTITESDDHFRNRKTYFQTDFYIWQRKTRKIMLDISGQPLGGKWSFDTENRERFPKNEKVPRLDWSPENEWVREAIAYTEQHYPSNPGKAENFGYPVTFEGSRKWLNEFLHQRFRDFGRYEDAMVQEENFLHHSVLSPMLNVGLLEPRQVVDAAIKFGTEQQVPMNSLEGFTRQIIGWREFIRIVYEREGGKQRTRNFFGFTRKIPRSFWTAETGIHPVDTVIRHTLEHGYTHHINRLMVLGNFMLLCEFDPDDVYRWFMEMYVDAYDWVMVPNVYGMTQFADGGLMTTKPYISGSNYLLKMGNWEKGDWQQVWDSLFWRFMHVHRDLFSRNPRMGMLLRTFDKMPSEKRERLLNQAENYLASLG